VNQNTHNIKGIKQQAVGRCTDWLMIVPTEFCDESKEQLILCQRDLVEAMLGKKCL